MPRATSNADPASPRLPWQAQAVWVAPTPDGAGGMEAYPPKRPAARRFLLTNDALQLGELLDGSAEAAAWSVVDLDGLHRLLHPESAAERLEERLGAETAGQPVRLGPFLVTPGEDDGLATLVFAPETPTPASFPAGRASVSGD